MNKYRLYIEHKDTETQRSCAKTKKLCTSESLCSIFLPFADGCFYIILNAETLRRRGLVQKQKNSARSDFPLGRICNPTAISMSICNAERKRITNPYTRCCRISNPAERTILFTSHFSLFTSHSSLFTYHLSLFT